MRRLKAIVTVLVLAVWSACAAHCAIANLTLPAGQACCAEDSGQSNQGPDASGRCFCSAIQSGGYVSQGSAVSIPLPLDDLCLFADASQGDDSLAWPAMVEVTLSPPEVARSWQFFSRAALLARAPSLIS